MKIIVTGGRDYTDFNKLTEVLKKLQVDHIAVGDCPTGADSMAIQFAKENNICYKEYIADWKKHGKRAGPVRNGQMVRENKDKILVAFPGGRGTDDCVRQAKELGIKVIRVDTSGNVTLG